MGRGRVKKFGRVEGIDGGRGGRALRYAMLWWHYIVMN